jgi:hypothetical protein
MKNLPPYYQHLAKGKIFSVVQELDGQALFGSHSSRDSWDEPPPTLRTLQPMDISSPAIEFADINITGLTPQQPSTLAHTVRTLIHIPVK